MGATAPFRQAADLEDTHANQGRLDRGRALRRSAWALMDDLTLPTVRGRLDEARQTVEEARQAFAGAADTEGYPSTWEIGGWHDDMVWILWHAGQNWQAVQHYESVYDGCMDIEDHDPASCALCMLTRLHAECGERDETLVACVRMCDLLGEPHWGGHDALEFMASVGETLRWHETRALPLSLAAGDIRRNRVRVVPVEDVQRRWGSDLCPHMRNLPLAER